MNGDTGPLIAITSRKPSRYTKTWYICIFWIKKEIMEKLYWELMEQEWIDSYRVAFHDPIRYPGCANIKIYIKDATRENMLRNLKALLNLDKVITFGSVEGRYDVCIEDTGKDEMVKTLKKLYEPVGLEKETVR